MVMRRIARVIALASFRGVLLEKNYVHVKESIKMLLAGEPHVGISFPLEAEFEGQRLLLEILSEKKDMESLHLTVPMRYGYFSRLEYSLMELEKINANNPKLHDVTLAIKGEGVYLYDEDDVHALVAVLKGNRALQLQSLSLESININAAVVGALVDALKENRLHSLNLSDVPLDVAGMQALADALKGNHSLQSLNLSGASLCDTASVQALADALKENSALQFLDLGYTQLKDDAVLALVFALKENETLHSLLLTHDFSHASSAAGLKIMDAMSKDIAARIHRPLTKYLRRM